MRTHQVSILLAFLAASIALFIQPNHHHKQTKSYFKFANTSWIPTKWIANDTRRILDQLLKTAFEHKYMEQSGIIDAIVNYITQTTPAVDTVQLGQGSQVLSDLWNQVLTKRGIDVNNTVVDLPPYSPKNEQLHMPVNQGEVVLSMATTSNPARAQIRMINLPFHELSHPTAKAVLNDAINSNASLIISDLVPNTGTGALYYGLVTLKQFVNVLQDIIHDDPIKLLMLPFLPLEMLAILHDSIISVVRSHSHHDIIQMLDENGLQYKAWGFESASYAKYLGVPALLPSLNDPMTQFLWIVPRTSLPFMESSSVNYNRTHFSHENTEEDPNTWNMGFKLVLIMIASIYPWTMLLTSDEKHKHTHRIHSTQQGSSLVGQPAILAIGTTNPPTRGNQDDYIRLIKQMDDMPDETKHFIEKIIQNSGTEYRHVGMSADILPGHMYYKSANLSPTKRHQYWNEFIPNMAIRAAKNALESWGGDKTKISHVVFHSCTGFKAPGVELDVVDALGLVGVKRRLGINYMGCFGGFTGMSVAKSFALSDPGAIVLVICAEMCSAHITATTDRSKALGNAVFADGAAAAIVGPGQVGDWVIRHQSTRTLSKSTRSYMTWAPSDGAYDMYLDKSIGVALNSELGFAFRGIFKEAGITSSHKLAWCIHPGGRKLLDTFATLGNFLFGLNKKSLVHSYDVLREYGNMSSPTIFFVIKEMMEKTAKGEATKAACIGFGPGLTVEFAALELIEEVACES
mmetsp:Transcript_31124/g.47665  ORF Transcript_31124/g.47665 Transcript_31124/m.47665 type:complete len:743 (-) Transcript_31124:58-2286(-)